MPQRDTLILFFLAACIANASPGPSMLYVMSRSFGQGKSAGISSAFGLTTGLILHVVAASFGLSAIFLYSPATYMVVKFLGAIYLVYIGIQTLRAGKAFLHSSTKTSSQSTQKIYYQGIVTELLNPKTALFFIAFLPQFTDPLRGSMPCQVFILGIIFVIVGFSRDIVIAIASHTVSNLFQKDPRIESIQRWLSGSVLIGLGAGLALSKE